MVFFTKPFWLVAILTSLSTVVGSSSLRPRDPDILYYKGEKLFLKRYELDPLLKEEFGLLEDQMSNNDHFSYVATWEIANDMLYLRSINAPTAWVLEMANIFPGHEQGQCVPATWVVSDLIMVETPAIDKKGGAFYFWIQDGKLMESKYLIISTANKNEPAVLETTEDEDLLPAAAAPDVVVGRVASRSVAVHTVPPPRLRSKNEEAHLLHQYRDDHPTWCAALMGKDSVYTPEEKSLANEEAASPQSSSR
jgi:hypothetical protein